jgi:hypothetical protein
MLPLKTMAVKQEVHLTGAMTIFDRRSLPAIALAQAMRAGPLDKSLCLSAWVCLPYEMPFSFLFHRGG